MDDKTSYLTSDSLSALKTEYEELRSKKIPEIAKRIDEAKQQGDLSENAEYHQAREDMSWAQGRLAEVEQLINTAQIITHGGKKGEISLGSTVTIRLNGDTRDYTIVGAQEASPASGRISNESPLGSAFLGHKKGDKISVAVPSGQQIFEVLDVK